MKKIVKTVLLACLVILPLFALSACSSRSHFATQKDQWQTYTKEKKIKIGFDATFVPMGYEEKDGSYIGFDIYSKLFQQFLLFGITSYGAGKGY